MNLTLKQLFKFAAVGAFACAISANAATNYIEDSFEEYDGGSLDLPIAQYKLEGAQSNITNWLAEAGDASTIVSNDAAYGSITGDGPIDNPTAELILNLETEGNTLSRRVVGVDAVDDPAYIDTLIQFTPSEDDPEVDMTDVKVALYVNAQSNLVVMHEGTDLSSTWPTNSVIDGVISPDAWYRLTMEVKNLGGFPATKIYLDGTAISHPNALNEGLTSLNGEWFLNDDSSTVIDFISFQGTGLLDELVVSDTMPDFGSTAIMITLVPIGDVAFSPVGPVESGTEVTITAGDWDEIVTVTGPVNEDVSGLLPADSVVTTLTAAASCSVTATVAKASGNAPMFGGEYSYASVGTWAEAQTPPLGEGDVTPDMEDNYLLNVDADMDPLAIQISSIDVAGNVTTIEVIANTNAVDFTQLNGSVVVNTSSNLVDWTDSVQEVFGVDLTTGQATVTVTNGNTFLKAVVE